MTPSAENVRRLRLASGFEVLPENPPAHVYLGDWHLLDYFAFVAEQAPWKLQGGQLVLR